MRSALKSIAIFAIAATAAKTGCKTDPSDPTCPSTSEWNSLNQSIRGALLATTSVASTCWTNNPFDSQVPCNISKTEWTSSIFHASLPESIGAPLFANNSCLPPGATGYLWSQECHLGGLPSYIVNANSGQQVATAMKWAADYNIRIVVKGTGHELNGLSVKRSICSIYLDPSLRQLYRNSHWQIPGSNSTEDVFVIGSGLGRGDVLDEALNQGRVVTTGQDGTVGPGGYTSGGGHGPLASTYGLGAQQVLQAMVVTTRGEILTVNSVQKTDLFWAIRDGGGRQPFHGSLWILSLAPVTEARISSSWDAAAVLFRNLPDLMDAGLAGAMTLSSGTTAQAFNPSLTAATSGAVVSQVFWGFNMSSAYLSELVSPVVLAMREAGDNQTLSISSTASEFANYSSFYSTISGSKSAGSGGVLSSRLLGQLELVDIPQAKLASYLQRAVAAQNATQGTFATIGLSGGPGVINTPENRWGSLIPSWRSTYVHMYVGGASAEGDDSTSPKTVLRRSAEWIEDDKESLWREWTPNVGAYMNEGNPCASRWKEDFYGCSYDRLLEVMPKYDPTESLYVLTEVGSDAWQYDLQTGKLCRT